MTPASASSSFRVPPSWRIVPPGCEAPAEGVPLLLGPGEGWGDGAHETTQLCLQAIALLAPRATSWRMLDFGSGSGLLAIAAARLGAQVDAVEIDELGLEHGRVNAERNGVGDRIGFAPTLGPGTYDLIVANILSSVLLDFAPSLASRLAPTGTLVLSGLVATDVPVVGVRYGASMGGRPPEVFARGEWRALVWRGKAGPHGVS